METEVEFHLTDDDLPPEALKDCFRPPQVSTLVHCIHCGEEYDSWRMVYRVRVGHDGKVRGFWDCGMPGCDGAGFQFDIFPVDPHYVAEDGQVEGGWVDEHEEDCECEECVAFRAEMEQWEKDHPMPPPKPASPPPQYSASAEDIECHAARKRIDEALAAMGDIQGIPLDDVLPDNESPTVLSHSTMMEIEEKLGLRAASQSDSSPPQRREPQPLPDNWRELLAREEAREAGPAGEDNIPF